MILTTSIAPQSSVTHSMPVGVDVHLNHSPMIRIWEDNGNGGETKIYESYTSAASAVLHVSSATWRIENFGWESANIVIEQEAGGGSGGLPAGAATEAAQDTGNASLASLDTKVDDIAKEATQQAGNTLLGLIQTLLAAIQTLLDQLKATAENQLDIANAGTDVTEYELIGATDTYPKNAQCRQLSVLAEGRGCSSNGKAKPDGFNLTFQTGGILNLDTIELTADSVSKWRIFEYNTNI